MYKFIGLFTAIRIMDSGHKLNIKIVSYNFNSLRLKVEVTGGLLMMCDILLCRQVILLAEDCYLLEGISESFIFLFISSKAPNNELGEGRPSGGMVVFYKNVRSCLLNFYTKVNNFVSMR